MRLRGGTTRVLTWPSVPPIYERYKTKDEVVAEIDRLLNEHTYGEIATILNERGHRSGHGHAFSGILVKGVRENYGLKSRRERLRDRGLLTVCEAAERLNVSRNTVNEWRKAGLLRGHPYGDGDRYMFEIPDPPPIKQPGQELSRRLPSLEPPVELHSEV